MYADRVTTAMQAAMDEAERRRARQIAYNEEHDITPQTVTKAVRETIRSAQRARERAIKEIIPEAPEEMEADELAEIIAALQAEMKQAAADLEFERAAQIRDEIEELKALQRAAI